MSQTSSLPFLLSVEFGIDEDAAADVIAGGYVDIDGQPFVGDITAIAQDEIMGKEIIVWGRYVSFRFTYTG